MKSITIKAESKIIGGEVMLPLSKSISNRALMMSAISGGLVKTGDLSTAEDTVLLQKLLQQIKEGKDKHINAKDSGTAYRFLTAYLAITPGEWILDGDERMRQRPIGPLVKGLQQIDADIIYTGKQGYPPLVINGKDLQGGEVFMDAQISSQYISALMMIAPYLPEELKIILLGYATSLPYIYMTANMMKKAGADVKIKLPYMTIGSTRYKEVTLPAETDWSAAAFWYELMALSKGGEIFLPGLKEETLQGDAVVHKYFRLIGVETEFVKNGALLRRVHILNHVVNFILADCPDIAPSLIVTTAALGLEGHFCGISTLKYKESDRLKAIAVELKKCGFRSKFYDDTFEFEAQDIKIDSAFDSHGDHRIAMAFAPLAMLGKPITINNPEVVNKSYPGYWEELNGVLRVELIE